MGEIRRRGSIYWIRYYRGGQRHEESAKSQKKQAAIDLLRLREGDIAKGLPITAAIGRLRFDEAVADVETDYRVNGRKTLGDVERRIRLHLKPYFGGRRMASITTADIRRYIQQRLTPVLDDKGKIIEPGASNAQVNRELAIVKRAFRLAQQGGKLLHRPHVPMLEERNVRQGFFERPAFETVRDKLPAELQGIATFAYFTGWRVRSEILPLTWAQVDRQRAKTIRLEPGQSKNAEGRTLPYGLLPELEAVIETQWQAHQALKAKDVICPSVFNRDGEPVRVLKRAWNAACREAGYPGMLMHDLRRTAVRNLVRAGVPEKTAMMISGHRTRSIFDRYDIVSEGDLRSALGRLSDAAGTEKGQSRDSGTVAPFASRRKRKIS